MSALLTNAARQLRNNATQAERHLWYVLRGRNLGVKFRRQAVVGRYIVDFICYEKKLVIEVDGGQHAACPDDATRDAWLRSQGFCVFRFWNNEVLGNRDGVVDKIVEKLMCPSLALPTRGRE